MFRRSAIFLNIDEPVHPCDNLQPLIRQYLNKPVVGWRYWRHLL